LPLSPAFRLIGGYSPTSLFPGIVLPVFADEQNPQNYYLQVLNDRGEVAEFRRVANRYRRIMFYEREMLFSWVGQRAVFGYALSDDFMFFSDRESDFRERLAQLESEDFYLPFPLSGVEVARYLGEVKAECKYAEMAAVTIAAVNHGVAEIWVQRGVLSKEARISAKVALSAGYQLPDFAASNKSITIIEQTPNFSKQYLVAPTASEGVMLVTGPEYRTTNQIGVFHIDALLIDASDVRNVDEGASTEYGRLIASGKCSDAYLLVPSEGGGNLRYLKERGVKVIYSQDSGTPEWLIRSLWEKFRRPN
jgi:hypothetical protein